LFFMLIIFHTFAITTKIHRMSTIFIVTLILSFFTHQQVTSSVDDLYAESNGKQSLQQCVNEAMPLMQQMELEKAKPIIESGLGKFSTRRNEHNYSLLLYMMADYLYYNQEYKKARDYYYKAEKTLKEHNDTLYLMMTYNSIGLTYSVEQDDENTLRYYMKTIETCPENTSNANLKQTKLDAKINIINHYFSTGDYNEIIQKAPEVIQLATEINDSVKLGSIYNAIAIAHKNKQNFSESRKFFSKALSVYDATGNDYQKSYIYNNLGGLYEYNNVPDSALHYFRLALSMFENENYKIGIAKSKLGVASVLFKQLGNDAEAETYYNNAIQIARQNDFTSVLLDALSELAELEYKRGNYREAFDIKAQYHDINDSIFSAENQQQYLELKTQYEISQKENEINQLKNEMLRHQLDVKKNQLQKEIGLSIIFLLTLISYVFYIFYIRKKNLNKSLEKKNTNISEQNKRLKALIDKNNSLTKKLQHSRHMLMAVNITKSRFFSILAHDLRNPFHNILGQSFLLSNYYDKLSDDERMNYAGDIHQSGEHVIQLLDNLLEWGKTQTGDTNFDPGIVNLHEVAEHSITVLKKDADKKNIEIINNIAPGTNGYADENMLKSILRNLINNSIKFTNINGKIDIRNVSPPEKLLIEIEDNGKGIEKEALKHLFKPHSKFRTRGTQNEKGTGLGLVICAEFVKMHKGTINVKSEVGKGSTFTIEIPAPGNKMY
jgi:signal transduction histidine kinase/tetratricopeptide (TPR) repeat protein